MSGFIEHMATRATGQEPPGQPSVHLRRRSRFEPQPAAPQAIPALEPLAPRDSRVPSTPGTESEHAAAPPAVSEHPKADASAPPTIERADSPDPSQMAEVSDIAPASAPAVPLEVPDPLVIVRERVVPVLMESGVLDSGEHVEVVDSSARDTPPIAPKTVRLRVVNPEHPATPVAVPASGADQSGQVPDIHVHIDRVEVLRPHAQPQPSKAEAPRAQLTDHAEYLARRRGRP